MKRKHKPQSIKNKYTQPKTRLPNAPPSIRLGAKRGTGYNRSQEKKLWRNQLNEDE
jgi:hypothetical protein